MNFNLAKVWLNYNLNFQIKGNLKNNFIILALWSAKLLGLMIISKLIYRIYCSIFFSLYQLFKILMMNNRMINLAWSTYTIIYTTIKQKSIFKCVRKYSYHFSKPFLACCLVMELNIRYSRFSIFILCN